MDQRQNVKTRRKWYIGKSSSWLGPFTEDEVLRCIHDRKATWADFIWTPDAGMRWTRIANVEVFQQYLPELPPEDLYERIHAYIATPANALGLSSETGSKRRSLVWFLQFEGSEFGPLTLAEVHVILRSGKLKGQLFGWREGMENWQSVGQIPEFQEGMESFGMKLRTDSADERRRSKRVPLVATVRFNIPGDTSAGSHSYIGVCRDISAEGLLILSNRLPPDNGGSIRIEVSPLGASGVQPFSANAKVLRHLADKKGFSIRFERISEDTKLAIEKYLSKN